MAFHGFLAEWGTQINPDVLTELAWLAMPGHWGIPDEHVFLVQIPDAREIDWAASAAQEKIAWVAPSEALQMHDRGEMKLTLTQWYVFNELSTSLPRLHGLSSLLPAQGRKAPLPALRRTRPLKLTALAKPPREPSAASEEVIIVLPGDEEHSSSPGVAGQRHRVLMQSEGNCPYSFERLASWFTGPMTPFGIDTGHDPVELRAHTLLRIEHEQRQQLQARL
jgi:hypothetical protein